MVSYAVKRPTYADVHLYFSKFYNFKYMNMWILFVIFFQACNLVHTNHPGNFHFSFYVPKTQFRGVDKGGGQGQGGQLPHILAE